MNEKSARCFNLFVASVHLFVGFPISISLGINGRGLFKEFGQVCNTTRLKKLMVLFFLYFFLVCAGGQTW